MKNRIKKIRSDMNLSQEDFGKKIKIVRSSVAKLESGENNPSEQTIALICREFNVNEEWLRTGNGEPYTPKEDRFSSYLSSIANGNDYLIRDIIEVYMELENQYRDALKVIAEKLYEKRKSREI
ncbi:helix-turn-helix transcriptional regulator [Lachnospiraceae bacterium NSJ-143]|nr:helix-turn-helix transcriptional regulator [Lachnospiraceae bacterium NSJ-143]